MISQTQLGNFYANLPGGFYRTCAKTGQAVLDENRISLFQTIDSLLTNFNLDSFEENKDSAREQTKLYVANLNRLGLHSEELGEEAKSTIRTELELLESKIKAYAVQRDSILQPLFDKIVEQGYDIKLLKN
ncbi:hypothetical protein HOK51_08210 [Candidatus Woesearchaeota archaeon]|jgi:hypothetical protein|nr:hypothetical protein [Candidatus Woesearchaeota archaeon]MBT6519808.1 hypothetical protein [Candidatus Woesearchaeota archaeon]MBT7368187.1 hypothetical protein [Candidatus Woesearchaeota archaeon]